MTKNKKKIVILTSITGIIILILGIAYAIFNYQENTSNQQLILGDIYMHYNETNAVSIENALPGADYKDYFEFTISGKNTYKQKDIYYDIKLSRGETPSGKTEENRIPDEYLKFKLVEVGEDDTETEIFKDKTYTDLTNHIIHVETIPKNTTEEINKTYRLYMVISDKLLIGNIPEAVFTQEEWPNVFASIKVNVSGDFTVKEVPLTASETILKSIENSTCNPIVEDEDGTIYLSGTKNCVNFNYVWYSGKLWRITAIYPDGTMKMITDGLMTTISYGENNKFYIDENTTSYMYQWLNQEFLPTLYNYAEIIVEDAVWNASAGDGTISTKLPVDGQEEVLVNASVGLLNSYEYYKSYQNTSNVGCYLNIGYYSWLLNPYSVSSSDIWGTIHNGNVLNNGPLSSLGVRPSVNLESGVEFTGGTGTENNPYRIKGDQEQVDENVTLINTRQSGEYVKHVDEETAPSFRIVGTETINGATSTKLVLNDYVRDTTDVDADSNTTEVLTRAFGTTTSWGSVSETDPTYWRGYLNSTWIKEVDPSYNSETGTFGMLEKGTYYFGSVTSSNKNYKLTVCKTVDNG